MASEDGRIAFLLQRDGLPATVAWVRRTLSIYRHALLNRSGYGGAFRRPLVQACCEFRHWLRQQAARSPRA